MDIFGKRKFVIAGLFTLMACIFIIRLMSLQIFDPSYMASAERNSQRRIVTYPARGLIFDRNGKLMVYNKAAYDVLITPNELSEFDTLDFCNIVEMEIEDFRKELKKARKHSRYLPSVIVKQLSSVKYATLQEKLYKFPGFYTQTRTLREYPYPTAAHILGYVGEVNSNDLKADPFYRSGDYSGRTGIEKIYEKDLRGKKGLNIFMRDSYNRIKGAYAEGRFDTAAVIGRNITTTIDVDLQMYGEELMQGKAGSIVAIEPSTGEILALVSTPNYDPNLLVGRERGRNYGMLQTDSLKPLFNRALRAQYPPGSTFKVAGALIGLQEGTLTPEMGHLCTHGYVVGNFRMGCHHNGILRLDNSIAKSCNAYYAHVFRDVLEKFGNRGVREGFELWRNHVMSFGFGTNLQTDLFGEISGLVPTSDFYEKYVFKGSRWRALPMISLSIGQGELGFTPLQLGNYVATLANRGYYYTPHVVKDIQNSSISNKFKTKHFTSIDTVHFPKIIRGMEKVLEPGGTAAAYAIPGIASAGKTGTSENPHGADHSVYMGFAPSDNPSIAIAVYVENGRWGTRYAAPIATLMMEKFINDSIHPSRIPIQEKMKARNLFLNPEYND